MNIKVDFTKIEQAVRDLRKLKDKVDSLDMTSLPFGVSSGVKSSGPAVDGILLYNEENQKYLQSVARLFDATAAYIEKAVNDFEAADQAVADAII